MQSGGAPSRLGLTPIAISYTLLSNEPSLVFEMVPHEKQV